MSADAEAFLVPFVQVVEVTRQPECVVTFTGYIAEQLHIMAGLPDPPDGVAVTVTITPDMVRPEPRPKAAVSPVKRSIGPDVVPVACFHPVGYPCQVCAAMRL
jgi:hypothetical protein